MTKILHIIHGLNRGGAETFIYNIMKSTNPSSINHFVLIQNPQITHSEIEDYCKYNNWEIYNITDFRHNIYKHFFDLKKFFKSKEFDYVHFHMNAMVNPFPIIVGSKFVNKVIIHSHNTKNGGGGIIGKLLHKINTKLFIRKKFIKLACGEDAGKWMYGKKGKFKVIYNAVDLDKFKFNPIVREEIRNRYKIKENEFVLGHIGRFLPVKNQLFLVELLKQLIIIHPELNARLLLLGDGPDLNKVKGKVKELGLEGKVNFTGLVSNPWDFYSAFDCFLLPSLFEGFAFVAVEAQAAGLNVIASTNNTPEINITDSVSFLDLQNQTSWINDIIKNSKLDNRNQIMSKMKGSKFDINYLTEEISKVYMPNS